MRETGEGTEVLHEREESESKTDDGCIGGERKIENRRNDKMINVDGVCLVLEYRISLFILAGGSESFVNTPYCYFGSVLK